MQSFSSTKFSEINDLKPNEEIFVLGSIVGITKKLNREGKAFAIVSVEDFSGKCDCVFWGDALEKYKDLVVDEQPIAISGKIRKNAINDSASITVNEAFPISEIRRKRTKGVVFKVSDAGEAPNGELKALKELLARHPGNCHAYVAVEHAQSATVRHYKLPESYSISVNDDMIADAEAHLGRNTVLFRS